MAAKRRFSRASKSRRTPAGFPISYETQNRALKCRYITRLSIRRSVWTGSVANGIHGLVGEQMQNGRAERFRRRHFPKEIIVLCVQWYFVWRAGGTYLYRAIDSTGNTIEFLLSPNRDLIA